jgi:hypothetical protein
MWSLTSPRTNRISGPKNFRSLVKKDFFNTIDPKQTSKGAVANVGLRGIVLQNSQNAGRLIFRGRTKQAAIADQRRLKPAQNRP